MARLGLTLVLASLFIVSVGCGRRPGRDARESTGSPSAPETPAQTPVEETDAVAQPKQETQMESTSPQEEAYWRKKLTPEEYRVLREKGTERAFTGEYWDTKTDGVYKCRGCGEPLFVSDAKFDSGCGWPSFFQPLEGAKLTETRDNSYGMVRTEITCSKCGGHLGHVFNDGPAPTGLRYCINSVSIQLDAQTGKAAPGKAATGKAPASESPKPDEK
jgi:peptide-methionine (R)-S-oxide reductase